LGFKEQKIGAEFMNEMHTKFIYINTGVVKVPHKVLKSISGYFELPVEVMNIDLVHFENALKNGLKLFKNEG
jgi:hypothetical protein